MPYLPGQGKTAVALFADGLELKYVQLSLKSNKIILRDFKTVALVRKFEEKQAAASAADDMGFGDLGTQSSFEGDALGKEGGEEGSTNATVMLGLLNDIPPANYTIGFALSEPAITYQEFESNFGLKGTKLKKQIATELATVRASAPELDAIDVIPSSSGGMLAIIREDGLHLFELLQEIKSFLGGRTPNVSSIHSADVALMEMVRSGYEIQEEEVTVLIYVGHDFSRLIFMQGRNYMHFAPIISEGYGSPNIENTIYSRVLLEQDNIALTRIDRILLSGESHKVNLLDALAPQFPSALVEYLKTATIDISGFQGTSVEVLSEYAIPIVTAWRTLQPKNPNFYSIDLVPVSIIEGQKAFKLAWHGWIAAGMIIAAIVFFYTSIMNRNTQIKRSREELTQKQARLTELDVFRQRREQLSGDINRYITATTVYDSVAPGGDRWSRILHYLANSVEDLSGMWIYRIKPDDQEPRLIVISGRTLYRSRISRIASIFEVATLREVRTVSVRKKVMYEFDIVVDRVDKNDVLEPQFKK